MTQEQAWYALVESATEGFKAHQRMREAGFDVRIAPAPRGVQACCGMSIKLEGGCDPEALRRFVEQEGLAVTDFACVSETIDPHRNRFC